MFPGEGWRGAGSLSGVEEGQLPSSSHLTLGIAAASPRSPCQSQARTLSLWEDGLLPRGPLGAYTDGSQTVCGGGGPLCLLVSGLPESEGNGH